MDENKLSYVTKTFKVREIIEKSKEDDDDLLGYAIFDIATSHKDSYGDILTKSFLEKAVTDLDIYTSVFKNHNTHAADPIGKAVKNWLVKLEDGEHAVRSKVGFSKTAEKEWTLVKEGILNKASIGFYPDWKSSKYDEETDTYYFYSGDTVEYSLVGVPANNKSALHSVTKGMRDNHAENRNIENW